MKLENEHPHGTIPDFWDRAQDDFQCYDLLKAIRWPNGFICPKCEGEKGYYLKKKKLDTFVCANRACKYQCSLTAKTVFHGTHLPIRKWFKLVYHLFKDQSGCSSNAMAKLIGVSKKTVLSMTSKLRAVMEDANAERFMNALFVAMETLVKPQGKPAIEADVLVLKEELVIADGYDGEDYCKGEVTKKVERREIYKVYFRDPRFRSDKSPDGQRQNVELLESNPQISKVLASATTHLKRFLLGTHHRYCTKKFPLYLAEFVYRFNEPNPAVMFRKFIGDCIRFGKR